MDTSNPMIVNDHEQLARICKTVMVRHGIINPVLFGLRNYPEPPEDTVSVWRLKYTDVSIELVKERIGWDENKCCGYALIVAKTCRAATNEKIEVDVIGSNEPLYHAGISYSVAGRRLRGKQEDTHYLACLTFLAKNAKLILIN